MLAMAGASSYKREVLSPRYQTSCFPPLVEILHQLVSRVLVRPSLRRPQGYTHTFRNRKTRRCSPTACPSLAQLVIPSSPWSRFPSLIDRSRRALYGLAWLSTTINRNRSCQCTMDPRSSYLHSGPERSPSICARPCGRQGPFCDNTPLRLSWWASFRTDAQLPH